jgi:hypothetical protein
MGMGILSPLPTAERAAQRTAYRAYLADRDGAADIDARTLAKREDSMKRFLGPPIVDRTGDRGLFDAQYRAFDPARATPAEVLLLLTFVKVNAVEAYGVNKTIGAAVKQARAQGDDLELVVMLEEHYHTQILLSAARLFGFAVTETFAPPAQLKALIFALGSMPKQMARPLVLAAEIAGVISFSRLLAKTHALLRDAPVLRDAMEERLTEVLIDEVGHVSFNRLCLGPWGMAQARASLPLIAFGTSDVLAETDVLGVPSVSSADIAGFALGQLPEEVRRRAFVA